MSVRIWKHEADGKTRNAENDAAFGNLVSTLAGTDTAIHGELHTPHTVLILQLCAYLRRDGVGPWYGWQIEVSAKSARELFWRD